MQTEVKEGAPLTGGPVDRSVRSLSGESDLRAWLESQGFRCAEDPTRYRENECNWYAYRRSRLDARRCECNDNKPGMQIVVKPSAMQIGEHKHRSTAIELCGEANGVWWNFSAYSLRPEEVPSKLAEVETALIAAWNALRPNPKVTGHPPEARTGETDMQNEKEIGAPLTGGPVDRSVRGGSKEWLPLTTIEEITKAVERGDEIQMKTKYGWKPWQDGRWEYDLLPKRSRRTTA